MPSAAAKIEKPASLEGQDSLKSIVTIFEKKTRNLEKRKGKLELLKKELEQGKELNEDQKAAVGKYDQVQETLELTKELQKSVTAVVQEHLRQTKRQARREQLDRQAREAQRVRELLEVQDVLMALGSPAVRQCFLDGEEGAPRLSAETLDQLDQLYKLVAPDREECEPGTFPSLLTQAAEHLVALLDARPRPLLDTTYKALREVLLEVQHSAYFSGTSGEDTTPAAPPSEEDATATEEEEQQPQEVPLVTGDESPVSEVPEPLVEQPQQPQLPQPVAAAPSPLREVEPTTIPVAPVSAATTAPPPLLPADTIPESAVVAEATSLVPGRLDFFQESQIDLESPHMDPAVVAALPSVPAMAPPPAAIVQPAGFVLTAGPPPHPATVVPPLPHHTAPPPHQPLVSHTIAPPPQPVVQSVQQPVVQQQPPPPQPLPQQPPPHQQPQPQLPSMTMDYSELVPIPTVTFTNQSLRSAHSDDRRPRRGGPGGGPPRRGGYTNGKGPQWQHNGSGHDRPEGFRAPRQAGSGPRGGQHQGRGRPAGNRGAPRNTGVPAAAYAQ
ncbi:caprin-1-like [Dermacentor albipictus]|uniref:caprin-1-like n=1 Tax=Dermacentor albipictus TaxID=60249 RepID=UPI0031FDCB58